MACGLNVTQRFFFRWQLTVSARGLMPRTNSTSCDATRSMYPAAGHRLMACCHSELYTSSKREHTQEE